MQIFRIEDRLNRSGVYQHGSNWKIFQRYFSQYDSTMYHPEPERDDLLMTNGLQQFPHLLRVSDTGWRHFAWSGFCFGFVSIAQFRRWFFSGAVLNALKDNGFVLAVYEVRDEHCIVGHTQAVFDRAYHNFEYLEKTYELDNIPID